MIYYFFVIILFAFAIYNLISSVFNVPKFKTSKYINNLKQMGKLRADPFAFITVLSKSFAKYVPLSLAKEVKLNKLLTGALSNEKPNEFVARLILAFILICSLGIPLAFITPWIAIIPFVFAILFVIAQHGDLQKKSEEQQQLVEKEAPRLIENFSHNIKTNRNIINIFDNYINNYDSYLSKELAKTVEDMRTGSQEVALQRFELRMKNPLISQFVRGIIASLRGEDMTMFFNDLVLKVSALRKQHLTQQALKVKPKISRMSTIRAMLSIFILLIVIVSSVTQLKMI